MTFLRVMSMALAPASPLCLSDFQAKIRSIPFCRCKNVDIIYSFFGGLLSCSYSRISIIDCIFCGSNFSEGLEYIASGQLATTDSASLVYEIDSDYLKKEIPIGPLC